MFKAALLDIVEGLRRSDLWTFLGWHDVKQRYRRSTLGPFWITLASLIMIGFMTLVYAGLFNQSLANFLPLIAAGLTVWGLISACLIDGANVFIFAGASIKQVPAPLPVHVFRLVWQQVIFFLHNVILIVLAIGLVGLPPNWNMLLVVPGFALLVINLTWMVMALGLLSARFRDVPVIVTSFIAALFLVTPIVWQVEMLPPDRRWVAYVNPLTYLIEIVRLPALGIAPSASLWLACAVMAVVGWTVALVSYTFSRGRLAYWV